MNYIISMLPTSRLFNYVVSPKNVIIKFFFFSPKLKAFHLVLRCCSTFGCTAKRLSHTYIFMYPFSPNPLPSRLSHNIEQNFLCYTVGPCCLSILYIAVCIWPFPKFYLSLPPSNISLFSKSLSIIRLWLRLWTPYCQIQIYWRKVGKTTRTLRYDLNQIPYDYTVEVRNRFKGLDLIDRMPDELWTEVHDIVQETGIKTIPKKKKCKKAK